MNAPSVAASREGASREVRRREPTRDQKIELHLRHLLHHEPAVARAGEKRAALSAARADVPERALRQRGGEDRLDVVRLDGVRLGVVHLGGVRPGARLEPFVAAAPPPRRARGSELRREVRGDPVLGDDDVVGISAAR